METFKREIFEQLGNLFYAIAREQGISPLSTGELKMLMRKDWLTELTLSGPGDKVSEPAHLIGLTLDSLQTDEIPATTAYSAFETFYRKHHEQFSFSLKQSIVETAESILKIFARSGKQNEFLKKLKILFQESMERSEMDQLFR
jgi:hypothetical protein